MRLDERLRDKDVLAGLLLGGFGALGLWLALDYRLGTAHRMGPGYFPVLLSIALIVFGAATTVRGLLVGEERVRGWTWRGLIGVLFAVVVFAFTLRPLGLAVATVLLIVLGALAGRESRLWEALALAVVMAALAVLIFVRGLGVPFRVWPAFLGIG
jgi:hypothetical protein